MESTLSMPESVIVYSRFPTSLLTRLASRYALIELGGQRPAVALSACQRQPIRAVIAAGGQVFDVEMMDSLPSLNAIICYGAGYDGIDLAAAKARGIKIANSPGANASTVADLALALLLAAMRRIVVADHHVRSGNWAKGVPSPLAAPAPGMKGTKIGIYGMGEIGRKIALRAAAFESEIGYFSRSRQPDLAYAYHASLASLAEWADVLIVAVRASVETHHTVDAGILERLGPGGFVVNIARGSVIDQAALTQALLEGGIAGAGLDVFEREPQPADSLTAHPAVVLTPHIGGHTLEAHHAMQDCVLANLDALFAGAVLPYEVRAE